MSGETRSVNVGRLLDKIHIAMGAFGFSDKVVKTGYISEPEGPDTETGVFKDMLKDYNALGAQVIFRGKRGDGEIAIKYWNNYGKSDNIYLNAEGCFGESIDTMDCYQNSFDSVVASIFVYSIFGSKEINNEDEPEDPQVLGAAMYAKCLMSSSTGNCRSVLKQYNATSYFEENAKSERDKKGEVLKAEITKYEANVTGALELVQIVRNEAVKQDHWYNNITPKEIDAVSGKYKPLLSMASGATEMDKAINRYQISQLMLADLFRTPTGDALFWEVNYWPAVEWLFGCENGPRETHRCQVSGSTESWDRTCTIAGVTQKKSNFESNGCVDERAERPEHDHIGRD